MQLIILKRVILADLHGLTSACRHIVCGRPMPRPSYLELARYDNEQGWYLFYCSADGKTMTDTWHETEARAIAQAEWEFKVEPREWVDVNEVVQLPDPPPVEQELHRAGVVKENDPWELILTGCGTDSLALMRELSRFLPVGLSTLSRLRLNLPRVIATCTTEETGLCVLAAIESAGGPC